MKKAVILFGILYILIPLALAQSITIDKPSVVEPGVEFEIGVTLADFAEDVYDIKIDIFKEGDRVSEIWNGNDWQSTFNYVEYAIDYPSQTSETFDLNITESVDGELEMQVKIRDSEGHTSIIQEDTLVVGDVDDNEDVDDEELEENIDDEEEEDLYLEMYWDDEDIINGEVFSIELTADYLLDQEYDVKIWLEDDDGNVISDRYDEENDEWKSGTYYVEDFFEGPGEEIKDIDLRIREEYEDFEGDARIFYKLRDTGYTEQDEIEVLSPEDEEEEIEEDVDTETDSTPDIYEDYQKYIMEKARELEEESSLDSITGNVIRLGSSEARAEKEDTKDINTEDNTIYRSDKETIKTYALIFFAGLSVIMAILFAFEKLR